MAKNFDTRYETRNVAIADMIYVLMVMLAPKS